MWPNLSHVVTPVTCGHMCHMWSHLSHLVTFITYGHTCHMWSCLSLKYHKLPKVPLVQPKTGIIWSYSQNYNRLPKYPNIHQEHADHFFQNNCLCVPFTPPLPKSTPDTSMITMPHLPNVCQIPPLLDLTAPKVAAGKKHLTWHLSNKFVLDHLYWSMVKFGAEGNSKP